MAAQLDVEKDKNRYNGEGQRIRKEETKGTESSARNYYYQDGKVLYTTDGANQRDSFNLLGREDNVIATARGTGSSETWYLYNKDVRGSTSSLIDASGTAAAAYEYDEFGNTTIRAGADFDNELCYTGQVYDKETGLYYYNARFYDPEDGRFLTQDTYRGENMEPETLHLYAYCANNPVNYVDPSGHAFIRTYTRNQCRNTYFLLLGIDKTLSALGWISTGKAFWKVRKKGKKQLIKVLKKEIRSAGLSYFINTIINYPTWLYGKLKRGFKLGGTSYIRNRYYTKKGKFRERYEKILKTKLVGYGPSNFNFYYSSKRKKNIPMAII